MHEINVRSFSAETQVLQASRNESRLDPSAETSTSSRRTSDERENSVRGKYDSLISDISSTL